MGGFFSAFRVGFIVLAHGALLLPGCSRNGEPRELEPVTIAASSYIGSAPVFVAYEKGYFRQEGLDVSLIVNDAGVESLQNLFRREADIALVAELPLVYTAFEPTRYTGGGPPPGEFRVVADVFLVNNTSRILARRDHGIRTAQDLRGATVAAPVGTSIDYLLDLFLLTNRIGHDEISIVDMDVISQKEAIRTGQVDAIFSWQPHVGEARDLLGEDGYFLPQDLFYHNAWLAVVMAETLQDRPGLGERFLQALIRAEEYMAENPDTAAEIHGRYAGTTPESVARSWDDVTFWISLSESLLTTMDDQARWIIRSGDGSRERIPNFLEYMETGPLEQVKPEGVMIIQ